MEQWNTPMVGTLRIKNPATLEKWIHRGDFQKKINEGYQFFTGCGRFRIDKCECYKCRKGKGKTLQEVINRHHLNK